MRFLLVFMFLDSASPAMFRYICVSSREGERSSLGKHRGATNEVFDDSFALRKVPGPVAESAVA